ncbi:Pectate lyase [Catalinimonas alkaloidigena]|uniref:Pectate lyase n=1 Tax=Catalinimonas alkaloidigena TaxID=1075417 RepID=A0A1G8XMY3_9BACT|nr:hypothetical protein [Catalinimonas alkaloidigena]SDJ91908.1 Pectate lyase [Catalinimonas alkaloidigena]
MLHRTLFSAGALALLLLFSPALYAQPKAFPTAEGYGAAAKGGRGGKLLEVTNLHDHGPGSLRSAIEDPAPRTIIFDVSGTIELESPLDITQPFLTVAGQTAPGDGICLKNFPLHVANTHDVVIRAIRVRPGIASGLTGSELDGIEIRESQRVIIDHCTVSWTSDESMNTWHGSEDITLQWCMIAEPLHHSVHEKGAHGYGASLGGKRATYHHNLFAHATARNPSVAGNADFMTELMDFRNNVVFNWQHRSCDGKPGSINFVNNYYKPGPATQADVRHRLVRVENADVYGFTPVWYIAGNALDGNSTISKDNWNGGIDLGDGVSKAKNTRDTPFATQPLPTESAEEAYKSVLAHVGVCAPGRDAHERRIIAEVTSGKPQHGNGIIDRVEQGGGWPTLTSTTPPADRDHDGMPDAWERKHKLNPNDPADGNQDANGDGYTNLEEYLNSFFTR